MSGREGGGAHQARTVVARGGGAMSAAELRRRVGAARCWRERKGWGEGRASEQPTAHAVEVGFRAPRQRQGRDLGPCPLPGAIFSGACPSGPWARRAPAPVRRPRAGPAVVGWVNLLVDILGTVLLVATKEISLCS